MKSSRLDTQLNKQYYSMILRRPGHKIIKSANACKPAVTICTLPFQDDEGIILPDKHHYAVPRTIQGENKYLRKTLKRCQMSLYNANKRNKRMKLKMKTIKQQLEHANKMNDSLREELNLFSGKRFIFYVAASFLSASNVIIISIFTKVI